MSSISPYVRGYRLALRDVHKAVELQGHDPSLDGSVGSAIFAASDTVADELGRLRTYLHRHRETSPRIQPPLSAPPACVSRPDWSADRQHVQARWEQGFTQREFRSGYLAGFNKATALVVAHGHAMNHPPARLAVLQVGQRLEQLRKKLNREASASCTTLRRRRYALQVSECV